jgi:hypothetical protein
MLSLFGRAPALACLLPFLGVCTFASAQASQAVLADGRVLTQVLPVRIFATEGPMWNLDLQNQGIFVTGRKVTIPATLDGVPYYIAGSSVLSGDGTAATGIGGANFHKLLDSAAISEDVDTTREGDFLGPRRLGAARSLFSTSEARRVSDSVDLVRSPLAQQQIEQNYFQMVQACYAVHDDVLPPDFLDRAGIRGADPANWVYPSMTGGTLKSAGTVYQDANGNEYLVPGGFEDAEAVIELSENVATGIVRSVARGNATRPDSFVIGDMLVIFSQDPRFGADVLGVADAHIPREEFFRQVRAGETQLDTIGHFVGDHVMMVHEVLTEMVDRQAPVVITADRIQFRVAGARGEARWRGAVDKPEDVDQFVAVLYSPGLNGTEIRNEFPIALTPNVDAPGATYNVRLRAVPNVNLAAVTHIQMEARANVGTDPDTGLPIIAVVGSSERIDVVPFRQ